MRTNMQVSEGGRTDIGSRQGRIQETRRRWRSRWAVQNANERIVLATSGTLKRERKRTYITWRGVSIDPESHYWNLSWGRWTIDSTHMTSPDRLGD